MKPHAELVAALRIYAAKARLDPNHRVTEEEIVAYVNGELSGEQRERVEEAISLDPEAAELARDLAMFPEAPGPGEEGYLPSQDLARDWEALQARLPVPRPAGARRAPLLPVALAASLLAVIGLAGWGFHQRGVQLETAERLAAALAPQINVEPYTLTQASPRGTVPEELPPPVRLESDGDGLWLQLALPGQPGHERYRLEVRSLGSPEQPLQWSRDGLKLYPDGTFSVAFPRDSLPPGSYELRVVGIERQREEPVAVYRVEVAPQ